ncbi:hypothetical protein PG991_015933 [Apiospora marii]|uniref:F-box domain-containing protein n=1 Tax=Apiospora marii TaxID=335849 RepID=A0ABR1R086_9PEZI
MGRGNHHLDVGKQLIGNRDRRRQNIRNTRRQESKYPGYEALRHRWFNVIRRETTPGKETRAAHQLAGPDVTSAVVPTSNETRAGDVSMLSRLPQELRDMIYRHLLLAPEPISLRLVNHFRVMPIWYEGRQLYSSVPIDTALLRVNKQIHAEAAAVLYSENTFRVCDTSDVGPYMHWGEGQGQDRDPWDRRAQVKEYLVLILFHSRIRVREDKAQLIRRVQIASECGESCPCVSFRVGGRRCGIVHTVDVLQFLFKGLRIIELRPEFPRFTWSRPNLDVIDRHLRVVSEEVRSIVWSRSVHSLVFTEPVIPSLLLQTIRYDREVSHLGRQLVFYGHRGRTPVIFNPSDYLL